jgi:hypothetical protein
MKCQLERNVCTLGCYSSLQVIFLFASFSYQHFFCFPNECFCIFGMQQLLTCDLTPSMNEGKGPEKEKYEEKIRRLHLKRVAFRTMWLSAEDYPLLLGSKPSHWFLL